MRPTITKAELEQLWRLVLPKSYTVPIETEGGGAGFDLPASWAALFSSLDADSVALLQAYFIRAWATQLAEPGGIERKATVTLALRRAAPADWAVTLPQGTKFVARISDTTGGTVRLGDFETTEAVEIAVGDIGPLDVPVAATVAGWWGNVPAGAIAEFELVGRATVPSTVASVSELTRATPLPGQPADAFHRGQVGQMVRIVGLSTGVTPPRQIVAFTAPGTIVIDPPLDAGVVGESVQVEVEEWADVGLTVEQLIDAEGGRLGLLDAVGEERNAGRVSGELDDDYRERLETLDDTISPAALNRICERILLPRGIRWRISETRDPNGLKGFVWGLDAWGFGDVRYIAPVTGSQMIGQGAVWLSPRGAVRFFVITVSPGAQGEFGAAWGANPSTPPNAWGVMFWGGFPVLYNSYIAQLWTAINNARLAGVAFVILQDPNL
jgi:hypothetical protein